MCISMADMVKRRLLIPAFFSDMCSLWLTGMNTSMTAATVILCAAKPYVGLLIGVYVFAWKLGFGLPAVWASIAADNVLRAVLFAFYRRKGNWIRTLG